MQMALAAENEKQLQEVLDGEQEACNYAMVLASFSALPMSLSLAIELRLFELIAEAGPAAELTADDLSARLGASNPQAASMLDRILCLLASHSVFTCSTATDADGRTVRRYGAAPVCKYLTPNEYGVSISALALRSNDRISMESWYYVEDAVLHGGVPFSLGHGGKSEFEYHEFDPRYGKVFNEGMRSHSIVVMKNILEVYKGFEDVNELVDVGGGTGGTLAMITAKYPHIKGINFDLSHVIKQAPPLPGVDHVIGDMFASIPKGDTIFLKWILHDWNDEDCVKILKNCFESLPEGGKLIVVDCRLPEKPENTDAAHAVFHVDMLMLLHCPSGMERTENQFRALSERSGFKGFNSVCSFAHLWVMEFNK